MRRSHPGVQDVLDGPGSLGGPSGRDVLPVTSVCRKDLSRGPLFPEASCSRPALRMKLHDGKYHPEADQHCKHEQGYENGRLHLVILSCQFSNLIF